MPHDNLVSLSQGSASFISREIDAHEFKSQHIKITLQWDYSNEIDLDYFYYAHGCRNVYFGQGPSHMLDRLLTLRLNFLKVKYKKSMNHITLYITLLYLNCTN